MLGQFIGEMREFKRTSERHQKEVKVELGKIVGKLGVLDRWQVKADARAGTIAAIVGAVVGLISWLLKS
jgi:hypothetical protein